MKTTKEFHDFYNEILWPALQDLERERIAAVQKFYTIALPVVGVAVILAALFSRGSQNGAIWTLIIGGIIVFGAYYFCTEKYIANFKDKVIGRIIQFIDPQLVYKKDGKIEKKVFMASGLFHITPNIYNGDDLVHGKLGKTLFQFSELHASYERGHGKNRTVTPVFDGLLFIADFNKKFRTKLFVLPDKAEKLFGSVAGKFLQGFNKSKGSLINLEDPEFERHFAVYGDDQVEARYILTTSLMQRITELRKKSDSKISLSFLGGLIFIALPSRKRFFEPKIFSSILNALETRQYLDDLQLAIGIVEDLNLNTRIWSKQEKTVSSTENQGGGCPSCHKPIKPDDKYCPSCGITIARSSV